MTRCRHVRETDRDELGEMANQLLFDCGFGDPLRNARGQIAEQVVERVLGIAFKTVYGVSHATTSAEAQAVVRDLLGQVETGSAFVVESAPGAQDGVALDGFIGFVVAEHHIDCAWTATPLGWFVRAEAPHRGFTAMRLLEKAEHAARVLGAVRFMVASINPRLDSYLEKRAVFKRQESTYIREL